MKRLIKAIGLLYALLIVTAYPVYSQAAYFKEQLTLANMLSGKDSLNLQKAVYAVENAYYNDNLNEEVFISAEELCNPATSDTKDRETNKLPKHNVLFSYS